MASSSRLQRWWKPLHRHNIPNSFAFSHSSKYICSSSFRPRSAHPDVLGFQSLCACPHAHMLIKSSNAKPTATATATAAESAIASASPSLRWSSTFPPKLLSASMQRSYQTRSLSSSSSPTSSPSTTSKEEQPSAKRDSAPLPKIPRAALWIGAAGALPFVGGAVVTSLAVPAVAYQAMFVQMTYANTTEQSPENSPSSGAQTMRYTYGVVPSLLSWGILNAPNHSTALAAFLVSFAGAFIVDAYAAQRGLLPSWYMRLRVPLTLVVLMALGATWLKLA